MSKNLREQNKKFFLDRNIKGEFQTQPLPRDASFRTYDRIVTSDKSYILMDSPTEYYSTEPFENVANWLLDNNFRAPQIFAADRNEGFLLIEDFGDRLFYNILQSNPYYYYQLSIDVLIKLHKIKPPKWLDFYSIELMLDELGIFLEYYVSLVGTRISDSDKEVYLSLWSDILRNLKMLPWVVCLKDYHVQNLMFLSPKQDFLDFNTDNLGILDFQDAMIASPIYDLVSILEDARIDVAPEFAEKMLTYYITNMQDLDSSLVRDHYDILGAQRNIRILGVFARKKIRDNNKNYLQFIPRVLGYLYRDLQNPLLEKILDWHKKNFRDNVLF
jgi:aminoglycoside/choline kinase family phosphotransferase